MRAIAIFRGSGWPFRRGFRHVLASVETSPGVVVTIDPAGGGIHLSATGSDIDDIAEFYRSTGDIVVGYDANPGGTAFTVIGTCVEVVKRVLGIRGFFILTPYQLYRRMIDVQSTETSAPRAHPAEE